MPPFFTTESHLRTLVDVRRAWSTSLCRAAALRPLRLRAAHRRPLDPDRDDVDDAHRPRVHRRPERDRARLPPRLVRECRARRQPARQASDATSKKHRTPHPPPRPTPPFRRRRESTSKNRIPPPAAAPNAPFRRRHASTSTSSSSSSRIDVVDVVVVRHPPPLPRPTPVSSSSRAVDVVAVVFARGAIPGYHGPRWRGLSGTRFASRRLEGSTHGRYGGRRAVTLTRVARWCRRARRLAFPLTHVSRRASVSLSVLAPLSPLPPGPRALRRVHQLAQPEHDLLLRRGGLVSGRRAQVDAVVARWRRRGRHRRRRVERRRERHLGLRVQ